MKSYLIAGLLFSTMQIFAQSSKEVPDTLVKLGGKKIPAFIKNVTTTTVYYTLQAKPKEGLKIERKDLEKAIRRNGSIEQFNKPAFTMITEGQWEAVLVTKEEKDITGLYRRKLVAAKSSPTKSKKKAYENALIKMQKLTANAGGSIVLITREEFFGGFGDNPGYSLEGWAYGLEPLEEGTNVIEDPSKKTTTTKSGTKNTKPQTGTPAKTTTPAEKKK